MNAKLKALITNTLADRVNETLDTVLNDAITNMANDIDIDGKVRKWVNAEVPQADIRALVQSSLDDIIRSQFDEFDADEAVRDEISDRAIDSALGEAIAAHLQSGRVDTDEIITKVCDKVVRDNEDGIDAAFEEVAEELATTKLEEMLAG